MEHLPLILAVMLAHLLAVISPGPDFLMTVRNSLTYSRRTGIFTAIGIGMGIAVHIAYCSLGLAIIISQSILLFNTIKLLGAAYLIFIGWKSFISKSEHLNLAATKKKDISAIHALRIGFLTNVLNPKATLFFLSLFTFVISPSTPMHILILASGIMIFNTALWFTLVAIFLTHGPIQRRFDSIQGWFNKAFGVILIALGAKIALSTK